MRWRSGISRLASENGQGEVTPMNGDPRQCSQDRVSCRKFSEGLLWLPAPTYRQPSVISLNTMTVRPLLGASAALRSMRSPIYTEPYTLGRASPPRQDVDLGRQRRRVAAGLLGFLPCQLRREKTSHLR